MSMPHSESDINIYNDNGFQSLKMQLKQIKNKFHCRITFTKTLILYNSKMK